MSSCYIVTDIVQDITGVPSEGYAPFFFASAAEGGSYLLFHFTDESFTKVLSALRNGAYMTYGDEGRQIIWDFLKNVEYPVSFCAQMIECINNDADVQHAMVEMLKGNDEFNEYLRYEIYRITGPQIEEKLVPGDCDDSVIAGRAIALVNRLDLNNKDFLETVEVGTNDEERIAAIITAIPGLQEAGVGQALDVFQDFLEDFSENYNGVSTEGRKNIMARDIWCLMKQNEDCSITFKQLFDFYQAKATSGLTIISTLIDVANFLSSGDFASDNAVWYGMFALQIGFVLNSKEFYGVEIGTISGIMRDASPSSAWEDWDPCGEPPPDDCQDLTASDHDWYPAPAGFGVYHAGEGLGPEGVSNLFSWNQATLDLGVIISVTVTLNEAVTDFRVYSQYGSHTYSGSATTVIVIDGSLASLPWASNAYIGLTTSSNLAPSSTFRVVEVCIEYAE